jgi:endoglucanase
MKIRAIVIAVMLALAASVPGLTNQASANTVTQSSASQIVADMGAGWNLGNQLEANINGYPSETAWGQPTVTQALIDRVKAAGFQTIRIPVSYLNNIGPGPDYTIDPAWLNRIQQVVDYAYNRDMHVVINMHGDGYKTITGSWLICDASSQSTIKAKYQRVWQQVASRFQDYDQRLILESMNEEFTGDYGTPTQPCYSNINDYNQIFVDTVRRAGGNNSSRWLLVPGWNTNIDYTAGNYGFTIPTDQYRSPSIPSNEQRIMISVHYYDPWDFAGEESGSITQWGPAATNSSRTSTWGQEDFLDSQLKKMYDRFVVQGYPVVVGEYGSIDKSSFDSSNNRYRADYAHTVAATATKYGAATVYWDNGTNGQYGFGLFDRRSYAVTQQGIIDAIMSGVGSPGGPGDDTQAPTAPGTPSASAVSATSATLSWAAATDNVGVSGYDIVRVSGGTETQAASSTSTRVTVSGLSANTAYTFAVYARDAAGNRSARSATVAVTTGPGDAAGTCSVAYRSVGDWGSGFQGEISVRNTGTTALDGWTLGFSFANGQTIDNMWGGTPTQNGGTVSVTPASYTRTIPAGGTITLGFTASRGTTNTAPTAFTLDGTTCATA